MRLVNGNPFASIQDNDIKISWTKKNKKKEQDNFPCTLDLLSILLVVTLSDTVGCLNVYLKDNVDEISSSSGECCVHLCIHYTMRVSIL
jgi:hypothetical protein